MFLIEHAPVISVLLIVACFILTRLPFFLHYRLVDINADYWSYLDPIMQARRGQWPRFYMRTPGYPLFLAFILSISPTALSVVIAQCLATLAAALATLACFVRGDRRLAYPAAFALIGFTASTHSVYFDTALMPESLYCSLLNLSIGILTFAVLRGGALAFLCASLAMAGCILERPAGFFFFGVYALVLGWLILRRQPRRQVLAFLLPLPLVFLALCTYNRLTLGAFTITPFGDFSMLGVVATFAEEDQSIPVSANQMVRDMRDSVTAEDRAVVLGSRSIEELHPVFLKYYGPAMYKHSWVTKGEYVERIRIYGQLARLSIRRHPEIYLKFVAVNFYKFYQSGFQTPTFYDWLRVRYEYLYLQRELATSFPEADSRAVLMEYWDPPAQPHIWREGEQTLVDSTWTRRLQERFNQVHSAIFSNVIWLFAAILLFPVAIWKLVRSRDAGAFLVFTHLSALAGAGLVVGLTVFGMWRYGVTSLFLCHLTPVYLCLLTRR